MPSRSTRPGAAIPVPEIRSVMTRSPLSVSIDASVRSAEDLMIDNDVGAHVCSLDVYAVAPEERLDVVLARMAERRLGSAVVTDGGRIAGVFTATDACRCFADWLRAASQTRASD